MVSREIRGLGDVACCRPVGERMLGRRARPGVADPAPSQTRAPAYDASLEPSAAVLSLVPEDAETVTVTDFDQVRVELGME